MLTQEEFLDKFHEKFTMDEYEVIGKYKGVSIVVDVLHKKCNSIWTFTPSTLKGNKHGCPECSGNNKRMNTEIFKKRVKELCGEEYSVNGEYVNSHKHLEMIHNVCGNKWLVMPNSILTGKRCPTCKGGIRKTLEKFKSEVYDLTEGEYEVVSDYVNKYTKIKLYHKDCDSYFHMTPEGFLTGSRCLNCNASKGEHSIQKYLQNRNIEFKKEVRFEGCKHKRTLPFDFVIYNNNKLYCLIEFDGEQHFRPRGHFGGDNNLKEIQKRDSIKNEYCKENNIKLIRIPYWDFNNIEEILDIELKNLIIT